MTEGKLTPVEWDAACRRAALHYWAYEDLVVDAAEDLQRCYEAGDDPDEAIKTIGKNLDLFEFGPAWGGW